MSGEITTQLYRPGPELEEVSDDIWAILTAVDAEFIPTLSVRPDTTSRVLTQDTLWGGPVMYFEKMMKQPVILARLGSELAGLSTFRPQHYDELLAQWTPSTYVTTTAVLPHARRRGVARALNKALDELPTDLSSEFVTRRTWSTNEANLSLLTSLGFREVVRIPNHRAPGIDTIYLARPSDEKHQVRIIDLSDVDQPTRHSN